MYISEDKIYQILKKPMLKEYQIKLKQLYYNLNYTLKNNPHNTFKGTVRQYILTYKINNDIKRKLLKHYLNFNDHDVNIYLLKKFKQY